MRKSEWYTFWQDQLGRARLEFFRGKVFLHVELERPFEGMKRIHAIFPDLKAILRALGYRLVHVIIPEGDDKLYRFELHYGFHEVVRRGGRILMEQEI